MKRCLVALVALAAASCNGSNSVEVDAIFDDVGDLTTRSSVQFVDVKIGTVTGISLEGRRARVSMKLDGSVSLAGNVHALIRSTSLLGEKFVEIRTPPRESPSGVLRSGQTIPVERTGKAAELEQVFLELGDLLQAGAGSDLASIVGSSGEILSGREERLGEVLFQLRLLTETLAARAPEIGTAVDNLDSGFAHLAGGKDTLQRVLGSAEGLTSVLTSRQGDLDRLLDALDRFASVAARYSSETKVAADASLKDLRSVLDEVMTSTSDLEAALPLLARYVELWPLAVPGDYIQMDVVGTPANEPPPSISSSPPLRSGRARPTTLEAFLFEAVI